MPTMNELHEAVYRGRFEDQMSKGADAARKSMKDLGDEVVVTDEKVRKAERSFEQVSRKYDETARRAAQLARATKEYEAAVRAATSAVETGAKTQAEADEVLRRAALVRDAAFDKANAQAEKQRALYAELENAAGRASKAYQTWSEVTQGLARQQTALHQTLGLRMPTDEQSKERAEDIRAYGRALDELRARISPLFAAELQFLDSVDQVNYALKTGAISTIEATLATERYRASLERAARAATEASQAKFNQLAGITMPDSQRTNARGEDVQAYGRAFDELKAKINPLFAAELQFRDSVDQVNHALRTGVVTTNEAVLATERYRLVLENTARAATASSQARFNQLAGISLPNLEASSAREEDIRAYGRALETLRSQINPLFAAELQFQDAVENVSQALASGAINTREATTAMERYRASLEVAARAATASQQAFFNQLAGITLPDVGASSAREADIRAYGLALDELRAKINPLFAAELQFKNSILEVDRALESGAITYAEATIAAERYRVTLEGAARAATAVSQAGFNQLAGVTLPDDVKSAARAEDIRAYGRALDELRARINPLYSAELEFTRAVEEANRAVKTGAVTSDEAKMAIDRYRLSLEAASRAATAASQDRFNQLAGVTLPDEQKTAARAADMAELSRSIDATRAKYVPLVAEMQRYEAELAEIRAAEKHGILTRNESNAAIARATDAYHKASQGAAAATMAYHQSGRQLHLTSNQLVQLSYQVNDVIAQSAVGTNPMIILAQQGPQVVQALGGITAAWRALLTVLGPVGIGLLAVGTALAIPVAVANSNEARLSSMRRALRAYRDDYVEAADDINEATRRINLDSPGFGLSEITDASRLVEQARAVSQLSTSLEDLMSLTRALSKTMDTDMTSASQRMARAMRDPASVAKELSEQGFPGLTEQLRRQIDLFQRSGDRVQAFTLLYNTMMSRLRNADQDGSPLKKALDELTKSFQNLWEGARPGFEATGNAIIGWARSLLGYIVQLRDATRDLLATANTRPGGNGGAWLPTPGAVSAPADLRDAIARVESGGRYNITNQFGFAGRYQFGVAALHDTGIYQMGDLDRNRRGDPVNAWSGTWNFPGVNSLDDFLRNEEAQNQAFERYLTRLNAIIDREGLLNNPDARIAGLPVTREALLGVGWGRPADMAALVRGQPGGQDGNGLTSLERYRMFYRDTNGAVPVVVQGVAPGAAATSTPNGPALQLDEMLRRARGYSGNQQPETREAAMADLTAMNNQRNLLEQQNEQLRAQRDALDPASEGWRELSDRMNDNSRSIDVLSAGMDGARATLRGTLTPVEELMRGWQRSADGTRDQGTAAAFLRDRLTELNETSMRFRGTNATVEEQHRATSLALSELSEQYRNAITQIDRQVAGGRRIAAASLEGAAAMSRAEAVERAREEVRKTTLAGTSAEAAAIENLTQRYLTLASVEAERATARRTIDREQELETLNEEVRLLGASATHRAQELAVLRERQAILRADPNADLGSPVNSRALQSAAQLAAVRTEAEQLQASFNELANFGSRAFDQIGSAITEAFANGTMATINWGNIAKAVMSQVIQLAIRLTLLNPMLNWAFGQNNPTLSSTAQALGMAGAGGGGGGAGGLSSLSNLLGLRSLIPESWMNSLGITNVTGGVTGWINGAGAATGLFGNGLAGMQGPTLSGLTLDAGSAGLLGAGTLMEFAGGIGGGYTLGSLLGSLVAGDSPSRQQNSQLGAGGGALAGAVLGSFVPGLGTVVGGLIGGAAGGGLGGLFGPGRGFSGGDVGIGVTDGGGLSITGAWGKNWDSGAATSSVQPMLDTINQLLTAAGITVGGGTRQIGKTGFGGSSTSMDQNDIFWSIQASLQSTNDTMQALLKSGILQSWEDLNKTSPFALSGNANLAKALRSGNINTTGEVEWAANWIVSIYEPLSRVVEATSSWNDRLKGVYDTFNPAIATAKEYGLATEQLTKNMSEAVKTFHEDYQMVLRGIRTSVSVRDILADAALETDPVKKIQLERRAAMIQFDSEAERQRKELDNTLKDMYLNVWHPGEYNRMLLEQDQVSAKERLALWKQYEDQLAELERSQQEEAKRNLENAQSNVAQVISGLADYAAGLRTGDLSPLTPMGRLDAAENRFDETRAGVLRKDFRSISRLTGASDEYLSLAREVYGGGIGYAQIFEEVAQALEEAGMADEDALTASAMADITQTATETLLEELQYLRAEVTKLYTEVRQNNIAPVSAST